MLKILKDCVILLDGHSKICVPGESFSEKRVSDVDYLVKAKLVTLGKDEPADPKADEPKGKGNPKTEDKGNPKSEDKADATADPKADEPKE